MSDLNKVEACLYDANRQDECRLSREAFYIYLGFVLGEAPLTSSSNEYKLLNTFEFIKAVSNTVFDPKIQLFMTIFCDFYMG